MGGSGGNWPLGKLLRFFRAGVPGARAFGCGCLLAAPSGCDSLQFLGVANPPPSPIVARARAFGCGGSLAGLSGNGLLQLFGVTCPLPSPTVARDRAFGRGCFPRGVAGKDSARFLGGGCWEGCFRPSSARSPPATSRLDCLPPCSR